MAEFRVIYKANGDVKQELDFMGKHFDVTMEKTLFGAKGDKIPLDEQVEKGIPNLPESILETIYDMEMIPDNSCILKLSEFEESERIHE